MKKNKSFFRCKYMFNYTLTDCHISFKLGHPLSQWFNSIESRVNGFRSFIFDSNCVVFLFCIYSSDPKLLVRFFRSETAAAVTVDQNRLRCCHEIGPFESDRDESNRYVRLQRFISTSPAKPFSPWDGYNCIRCLSFVVVIAIAPNTNIVSGVDHYCHRRSISLWLYILCAWPRSDRNVKCFFAWHVCCERLRLLGLGCVLLKRKRALLGLSVRVRDCVCECR